MAEVRGIGQIRQPNTGLRSRELHTAGIPAEAKSLHQPTSIFATSALPMGHSASQKATPATSAVSVPVLSMNEKLIAVQWGIHYLQEAAHYTASKMPFTLPWNRAKPLSTEIQQQLAAQQQQLHEYEQTFASQKISRAGKNPFFQDKYAALEKSVLNIKQQITAAISTQKISSSDLAAIKTSLGKIATAIHELAKINKQLKHSHVKVRRVLMRAKPKNESVVVATKHNPVNNTCSEEVLRLNTHSNWDRFSGLQQFWNKEAPNGAQALPVTVLYQQTLANSSRPAPRMMTR